MRQRRQIQRQERRRGAALIEFAIIAPVFLALVLGIVEAGTALETSNIMSASIREGGRLASMEWEDVVPDGMTANEKVLLDIRNFLTAAGLPGEDVTLTITSAEGDDVGQTFDLSDTENRLRLFRISAELPYDSVSSYPSTFMAGQTVTASIVLRAGRVMLVN